MTTTTAERADILQQVGPGDAETLRVYTDGLSVYSGTKKHVGAYAVWIAEGHPDNDAWWTREGRVTNQTMELAGVLAGLEVVGRHCVRLGGTAGPGAGPSTSAAASAQFGDAVIYTTSHYVMSCMTRWLPRWELTGWITKQKRPVQNGDVLMRMAEITRHHSVAFVRVAASVAVAVAPAVAPAMRPQPHEDGEGGGAEVADQASAADQAPSHLPAIAGMKRARDALLDAAAEGSHSGCSKRRTPIVCSWAG